MISTKDKKECVKKYDDTIQIYKNEIKRCQRELSYTQDVAKKSLLRNQIKKHTINKKNKILEKVEFKKTWYVAVTIQNGLANVGNNKPIKKRKI